MNDDVRKIIYGTILVFLLGVSAWVGFLFLNACGFTLTCVRGEPLVDRTPMPTLIPATLPSVPMGNGEVIAPEQCYVPAMTFIGAWVEAGAQEHDAFQFTDVNGQNCEATFEEIQPLFVEANLWSAGSVACVACHSVDVEVSPAQLDLSSYAGILAGSQREDAESEGTDILGAGNWQNSLLYEFLSASHADIPGHTTASSNLLIFVGKPLATPEPESTATPVPTATATP
jgi:hypothetical protein